MAKTALEIPAAVLDDRIQVSRAKASPFEAIRGAQPALVAAAAK
jgi:hypothetical protein